MYLINDKIPNALIEHVVIAQIGKILWEKKGWVPVRHGSTEEDMYNKIDYIFSDDKREIPVQIKTKSRKFLGWQDTRVSLREIENMKRGGGAEYQIEACFDCDDYSEISINSKLLNLTILELNKDFIKRIEPVWDLRFDNKAVKMKPYTNFFGDGKTAQEWYSVPSSVNPYYRFKMRSAAGTNNQFIGIPFGIEFNGKKLSEILYTAKN